MLLTEFAQVYLRPKFFLLGSSLAFNLKEGPVKCAIVCDKSWVILNYILHGLGCTSAQTFFSPYSTVVDEKKAIYVGHMCVFK